MRDGRRLCAKRRVCRRLGGVQRRNGRWRIVRLPRRLLFGAARVLSRYHVRHVLGGHLSRRVLRCKLQLQRLAV